MPEDTLILRGGTVIDPSSGYAGQADVVIADGMIGELREPGTAPDAEAVDVGACSSRPGSSASTCTSASPDKHRKRPSPPVPGGGRRRLHIHLLHG